MFFLKNKNKENKKRNFALSGLMKMMACLIMVFGLWNANRIDAYAADIASGKCGTCSWRIDESGQLLIYSGTLDEYQMNDSVLGQGWPWHQYRFHITTVRTMGTVIYKGRKGIFCNMPNCTLFDLPGLKLNGTNINCVSMFQGCTSAQEIDISGLCPTNNTTIASAARMFQDCTSLQQIVGLDSLKGDISSANYMFQGCESLEEVILGSDFKLSNSISNMFNNCQSLYNVEIHGVGSNNSFNFGTDSFKNCYALTSITVQSAYITGASLPFHTTGGDGAEDRWVTVSSGIAGRILTTSSINASSQSFTGTLERVTHYGKLVGGNTFVIQSAENMPYPTPYQSTDSVWAYLSSLPGFFGLTPNTYSSDLLSVTAYVVADEIAPRNGASLFEPFRDLEIIDAEKLDLTNSTDNDGMFDNFESLDTVILGENFVFDGTNNMPLRTGYENGVTLTGLWVNDEIDEGPYSSEELAQNYRPAIAGTWHTEKIVGTRITFDANGGALTGQAQYSFTEAEQIVPVTIPDESSTTRPNYALVEWNTKADGTGTSYTPGDTYTPTFGEVMRLYAIWQPDTRGTYTIRQYAAEFDDASNPGNMTLITQDSYKGWPGDTVSGAFVEERVQDTLTNWAPASSYRLPEVNGIRDYNGDVFPSYYQLPSTNNFTYNIDLLWLPKNFTVSFDGNGADGGAMENQNIYYSNPENLSENRYYREGYAFTGWNTMRNGMGVGYTNKQVANKLVGDGETLVLYAQWVENTNEKLTSSNSEITVRLKAGQTVIIEGLPDGATYEIEETNIPMGWELTDSSNATGTLSSTQIASGTLTNTYSASAKFTPVLHKKLTGKEIEPGDFSFELYDNSGTLIDTAQNGAIDTNEQVVGTTDEAIPNPWIGTAPITFNEITFTEPGVYVYKIREVDSGNAAIVYDEHEETMTVTVTDAGDGRLSCSAVFSNTVQPETQNESDITYEKRYSEPAASTVITDIEDLDDSQFVLYNTKDETRWLSANTVAVEDGNTTQRVAFANSIDRAVKLSFEETANENEFNIYYADASGTHYLTIDNDNNLGYSNSPCAFTIEKISDNEGFYVYADINGNHHYISKISGTGAEFGGSSSDETESFIKITKISTPEGAELDGRTFVIANEVGGLSVSALSADATSSGNAIEAASLKIADGYSGEDEVLAFADTENPVNWTFEKTSENHYYITTTTGGTKKYLTINGNSVTLESTPDAQKSIIEVQPGTGENEGRYILSVNGYVLTLSGNEFTGVSSGNGSFALLEGSGSYKEPDNTPNTGVFRNKMAGVPLYIEKTLINATEKSMEKEFAFTILLRDHNGKVIKDYFDAEKSNGAKMSITNGSTFKLKADETIEIQNVPHGAYYVITEGNSEGFELVSSESASGIIDAADPPGTINFTNAYSAQGHVELKASKVLKDDELQANEFSFILRDDGGNIIETVTNNADGTINFTPMDFTLEDIGNTYVYYIEEVKGEDKEIRYDDHSVRVEFTVVDTGNGDLEVIPHYSDTTQFTNQRVPSSLMITKTVTGNFGNRMEEFPFSIWIEGLNGDYETVDEEGKTDIITFADGHATTTLSHDESITIKYLPVGREYLVTETDSKGYTVTKSGDSGVLDADGSTANFTNEKSMQVPTGADFPIGLVILGVMLVAGVAGSFIIERKKKAINEKQNK